jgi:hypothetical protein
MSRESCVVSREASIVFISGQLVGPRTRNDGQADLEAGLSAACDPNVPTRALALT